MSRLRTEWHACHVACFLGDRAGAIAAARAALATAGRIDEIPRRAEALLWLSEAVAYGLPGPCAREAGILAEGAGPEADLLTVPTALHRAAASLADPQMDPGPLDDAAATLRSPRVGRRRATLHVLAQLLEAEAARRRGDSPAAARLADAGISAATALGHVWLEARLRLLRAGLPGGAAQRERLRELVVRIADSLAPGERPALFEAWAPREPAGA